MSASSPTTEAQSETGAHGLLFLNKAQFENITKDDAVFSADIIAVHGANGHRYKTWQHKDGTLWLRDLLPEILPGSRIFTYGYPSCEAFDPSSSTIEDISHDLLGGLREIEEDNSSRPIVFICHGLGGLLVKQAILWLIADAPSYSSMYDNFAGVIFLSTPHRASTRATFADVIADLATAAYQNQSSSLPEALRKNSKFLEIISEQFEATALPMKLASLIELNSTLPFKYRLVDDASGCMNIPLERVRLMSANHEDICKFSSVDSMEFQELVSELKRMALDES